MTDVVVIGAGPAGLTAAHELVELGFRATVLEADRQVGGLSRTVNYRGYRFDIGGHRFFSKIPLINSWWQEMLNAELLMRPRLSRIYYRGHFFDYPLKARNALLNLGAVEAGLILLSYLKAKLMPHAEEVNFEQWVSNRFGYRLYTTFFKTYTEKVWGIPCAEIAADWAAQRIKNLSLREALLNALLGSGHGKDGQVITTLIDQFYYPRLGPGMMWEHCAARLAERGCETRYGVRIDRIQHRHGRVTSVSGRTLTGEHVECAGQHFISSMPLRELIQALDPAVPEEVRQAAASLRYRDYLTVVLIVKRAAVFPDNWIYIHAPEVKMGRIQNYKNWSAAMVPDPSRTALGLEYFLWESDEEWQWPEQRLIDLGIRECSRIGLITPDEVEDGTVVRMPKAYPVYDQSYHNGIAVLRKYLEGFENLQTIGRNGLHRYNNQDHAMLTGIYAARNLVGGQYDVWAVNTESAYHEEDRPRGAGDRLVPQRLVAAGASVGQETEAVIARAFAWLDPIALGGALGLVSGTGLWLATVVLLLTHAPGPVRMLSLLENYLPGYTVTWWGALLGLVEAGCGGFVLGAFSAWLRNTLLAAYITYIRRHTEAEASRRLLDDM